MIYTDLESILNANEIENKYALAMIVASRARQLSEQKGSALSGEGSERCISHSIEEIEQHALEISSSFVPPQSSDASVLG